MSVTRSHDVRPASDSKMRSTRAWIWSPRAAAAQGADGGRVGLVEGGGGQRLDQLVDAPGSLGIGCAAGRARRDHRQLERGQDPVEVDVVEACAARGPIAVEEGAGRREAGP